MDNGFSAILGIVGGIVGAHAICSTSPVGASITFHGGLFWIYCIDFVFCGWSKLSIPVSVLVLVLVRIHVLQPVYHTPTLINPRGK